MKPGDGRKALGSLLDSTGRDILGVMVACFLLGAALGAGLALALQ
jgi:hypothetical protein